MGNSLTQQELTLSESLQQQYFFQTNQFLFHKGTQRPCTLHRIETFSKQQSCAAERNIAMYKQVRCNSISRLNEHFLLDNSGYCSDQQKFYLVFDGHNSPNIKEEYFSRRYSGQGFSYEEIEDILCCMLCGVRHYKQQFHRKYSHISLESVCINRNQGNRLWLKDPWLVQKQNDNSQMPINFLASYPSPQKIQASNQATYDYDEFKSDLFSIGIFGLQFFNMNFRDDLYVHKKFVDRQKLGEALNSIHNSRFRGGLCILLSEDPNQREKIYHYWDIACHKAYHISKLTLSNQQPGQQTIVTPRSQKEQTIPVPSPSFNPHQSQVNPTFYNISSGIRSVSSNTNSATHFSAGNSTNRNVNTQKVYWKPNASTASKQSQVYVTGTNPIMVNQGNLSKQFSKQIEIKKGLGYLHNDQADGFKKSNNKAYVQPSTNSQVPTQSHPLTSFKSPSVNSSSAITISVAPAPMPSTQNQLYQSYNKSNSVYQSFQTPKFNYYLPSNANSDSKSLVTSFNGHVQASIPNTFQPNLSTSVLPNSNSPTKSISSSPILTKSIISPVEPPPVNYMLPKVSSEENTQIFSNNQSLRETKFPSQGERNTTSFGSLPIPNQPQNLRQEPKVQPQIIPSSPQISNYEINKNNYSQPFSTGKDKQYQALVHLQSSPEPINQQNVPKSPSTIQVTPPPAARHPNKYNSTIVQVNEQTPHESEESDNENNDIQFIVQEYETGSKYQGFKKNGLRHGRGKFFYQDGGYYDGEWKKNQMHGWGKLYYEGGQLAYEGNWAHDQFHGYGKVYNDNPVALEGGFDYTNFDLLDDYWQFYEGMLANDTKQGRGRIQLTNREVFEGDFHVDRIQGFGKFLRRDGNIVEGIWRDSRLIKILSSNDIHR